MKTGSNGLPFGQRWEGPEVKWYVKENVRDLGNVFFKTPKTVEGEIRAEVRLEERFFFFFFFNISAVPKWNELSGNMPKQKLGDNKLEALRDCNG